MSLNPVLLSWSDRTGGAARACYRLHQALRSNGIASTMRVRQKLSDDQNVHAHPAPVAKLVARLRSGASRQLTALQRTPNPLLHSANVLPSLWSPSLNRSPANVVNVHWVGFETLSIADLGRIRKPVVWTLHDMWPFCGAEHFTSDDPASRWRTGYESGERPADEHGLDINRWTWLRKQRHWRPMHVVAPTRWIAQCARDSALMRDWPVHIVPYALDVDVFQPVDRSYARQLLGVRPEATLILFGAVGGTQDPRKGADLLLETVARLADVKDLELMIFGGADGRSRVADSVPLTLLGPIEDDRRLAVLYSAADVLVVPSRQDNLPQTGLEAQACGTPVAGFRTHGLPDVVAHGITGFLAEPMNAESLSHAIRWCLDTGRAPSLAAAARQRALDRWAPATIAAAYAAVYSHAIADHP